MALHYEIVISAKSIGRILKEAGITLPHARKGPKKRRTRERMPQFGLLVQMDASPHHWLDDRGPAMSLHGVIDDATGTVLGLKFAPQENSATYMHLLRQVFRDYGLPHGLYTDRHTMFFSPKKDKLSVADELAGRTVALTQIGRALHSLGINHIPARSPQAKGRVERLWNTLQSRLVVEMRIAGITTLEEANAFLPQFTAKHNDLFAVEPADPVSAFREAPSAEAIDRALSIHHERRVTGGSVISYGNALYQLVDQHGQIAPLRNRSTVTVIEDLDGSILALHDGIFYTTRPLPKNKPITPDPDKGTTAQTRPPHVPADDHPWKNGSRVIPIEGLYERHLERDLWESLDNIWDRIYAQR